MKHYLFIILLQVCCYSCAQQKVSINQLIGTKWSVESPQNVQRTIVFSKEYNTEITQVSFSEFPEDQYTTSCRFEYYLSNKVPTSFNKKNGDENKGMYLVERPYNNENNDVSRKMWYYTIISYTPEKMVLFEKALEPKEGHIIMGGPPKDITLTLERIYE